MIERNLYRTVPAETSDLCERWWAEAVAIHPTWNCVTVREPVDPDQFPISSRVWPLCTSGAQKAGLIRLELVLTFGGAYVDSDVEVFRTFEPLRSCQVFAGWEDDKVIPDAVFGGEKGHPVLAEMLQIAITMVELGQGAWGSGPGVFTDVLSNCPEATVLPPAAFYPYHYKELHRRYEPHGDHPWVWCVHHWQGSWLSDAQRAQNAPKKKAAERGRLAFPVARRR